MGKRYAALVLPLFAVALAACSDDGPSPEESGLTSAEATALAEALDELGIVAVDAGVSGQSGPNLMLLPNEGISSAEVVGEDQFNYGISCPRGGSAAVEGQYQISVDEEAQSATIDVAAVQSHTDCGMRVSGTNDLFVDGSLQFVAQRVAADERLLLRRRASSDGEPAPTASEPCPAACELVHEGGRMDTPRSAASRTSFAERGRACAGGPAGRRGF